MSIEAKAVAIGTITPTTEFQNFEGITLFDAG